MILCITVSSRILINSVLVIKVIIQKCKSSSLSLFSGVGQFTCFKALVTQPFSHVRSCYIAHGCSSLLTEWASYSTEGLVFQMEALNGNDYVNYLGVSCETGIKLT